MSDDIDFERLYVPEERAACEYVYSHLRGVIRQQDFEAAGRILAGVDLDRLPMAAAISLLTVTLPFASVVPGREGFYTKVHERAVREGRDPDRLLRGLDQAGGKSAARGYNALGILTGMVDRPKAPG